MSTGELENLLSVVKVEYVNDLERKIDLLLQDVNFLQLARFVKGHPEFSQLYRFFDQSPKRYMVLFSNTLTETAFMFVDEINEKIKMYLLIKETTKDSPICYSTSIYRHFEQIIDLLSTYVLLDLTQHAPALP